MIIDTSRLKIKQGRLATPQSPVDGQYSPVPELPDDKLLDNKGNVVLNVFSKSNYVHDVPKKSSGKLGSLARAEHTHSDQDSDSSFESETPLIHENDELLKKKLFSQTQTQSQTPSTSSPLITFGSKQLESTQESNKPVMSTLQIPKVSKLTRQNSVGLKNGYSEKMTLKAPSPVHELKKLPKTYSP